MNKTLNYGITRFVQTITQRRTFLENLFMTQKSWYQSGVTSEQELKAVLVKAFPNASNIEIEDISGGCGAMFSIHVESNDFKGLSIVKQHQAVTNALKEQIKQFHGLRIETKVPSSPK